MKGAPEADITLAPATAIEAAAILAAASEHRLRVLIWGGGTHQSIGYPVDPAIVVSTAKLDDLLDWQPDDLTVVVGTGMHVAGLERTLAERGQTALLPETPGAATVGGVIATGESGWQRLRYGPSRDRVLEVTLATGDGRMVRAGGRVVKNVTGYDIARLATGSLGSLGIITTMCLKLWPMSARYATVTVNEAAAALATAFRPLAVIETRDHVRVYLGGTSEEIESQAAGLGCAVSDGLDWPTPLSDPYRLSLRVPARHLVEGLGMLDGLAPSLSFQAAHGVGEVKIGCAAMDPASLAGLRSWAEKRGGAVVVTGAPPETLGELEPWGTAPGSLDLQRKVKAAFDPIGVCNPGRLPGRL